MTPEAREYLTAILTKAGAVMQSGNEQEMSDLADDIRAEATDLHSILLSLQGKLNAKAFGTKG